jgi:hypothetical protein
MKICEQGFDFAQTIPKYGLREKINEMVKIEEKNRFLPFHPNETMKKCYLYLVVSHMFRRRSRAIPERNHIQKCPTFSYHRVFMMGQRLEIALQLGSSHSSLKSCFIGILCLDANVLVHGAVEQKRLLGEKHALCPVGIRGQKVEQTRLSRSHWTGD